MKLTSDELAKFDAVAQELGTDRSGAVRVVMLQRWRELFETRSQGRSGPANGESGQNDG